jgi:hypothetical protein
MIGAERVACTGNRIGTYIYMVGKPEGKSLLGRPKRRWKNNI